MDVVTTMSTDLVQRPGANGPHQGNGLASPSASCQDRREDAAARPCGPPRDYCEGQAGAPGSPRRELREAQAARPSADRGGLQPSEDTAKAQKMGRSGLAAAWRTINNLRRSLRVSAWGWMT